MWRLCEASRLPNGESARTPPLWRKFTPLTQKRIRVNSLCQNLWHRYVVSLWKHVVFLTVNHRGPLPLRELHSTDETLVWRDPGGSWACLRPVSDYELIRLARHVCGITVKQVVFITANHRGPLPLRELHSTDEVWVWRDPGRSWACLRPVSD